MKKFSAALAAAAGIAGFLIGGASPAALADYRLLPDLYPSSITAPINDLAMTPDDRYVVILQKQTMQFLDTWDFSVLSGGTATVQVLSGGTAMCLALSPDGKYAYAGLNTGQIAIVNISGIYDRLPGQGLAVAPTKVLKTIQTGVPIEQIAAVPSTTSGSTKVYLFLAMPAAPVNRFFWVKLDSPGSFANFNAWGAALAPVALDSGKNAAFQIYESGGATYLQVLACNDSTGCGLKSANATLPLASSVGAFAGLAADPVADKYVIAASLPDHKLELVDTSATDLMSVKDAFTIDTAYLPLDLALFGKNKSSRDYAFSVSGSTVEVDEVSGATLAFTGAFRDENAAGETFTSVAASSSVDRYAYAGGALGADYVLRPYTANPWIQGLSVVEGFTVESGVTVSEGYTVSFSVVANGVANFSYIIYKDTTFGAWNTKVYTSGALAVGSTVQARISASGLNECDNVLTVIAQDTLSRKGRMAFIVNKDTIPPAQPFDLEFGNARLIVSFTAMNLCDLLRYEIYFVTDPAVLDYDTLSANYTPITISSPSSGDLISQTITGLVNGVTYYVYVVTVDQGGKARLARKSGIPQATVTLTGLTGEDGGVNCLPSVGTRRRGDLRSLVWLLTPLLAAAALKAARRWKR